MQANREWISISDMMSGLMMVFLFIAVVFMNEIQEEKEALEQQQAIIKEVTDNFQNIYQKLHDDLQAEFKDDLSKWEAEILEDNTIRFNAPDVLFDTNSSQIKPLFAEILNDFFPRYLGILNNDIYREHIEEIKIEGHTSSIWNQTVSKEESYLNNMVLSQDRARSVLEYVYKITDSATSKRWLEKNFRANGMAFARLIVDDTGLENAQASQRVEFRVVTKSEQTVYEIIEELNAFN